jgi:hypothetical protein
MKVQKFAAGAVFAAVATAGMVGATPASAGPGVAFDNGTDGKGVVGVGDFGTADSSGMSGTSKAGANAYAAKGSQSLAISTGLNLNQLLPGATAVVSDGGGQSAVAIDGFTVVQGGTNNHGFAAAGYTVIGGGKSNTNNVVTVAGGTVTDSGSHDNAIVNFGGNASSSGQTKNDAGGTFVNVCGAKIWGQAAHINVSKGAC